MNMTTAWSHVQASMTSFCARFPQVTANLTAPNVTITSISSELPAGWQASPLSEPELGINWAYFEALVITSAPVLALTQDTLDLQSGASGTLRLC